MPQTPKKGGQTVQNIATETETRVRHGPGSDIGQTWPDSDPMSEGSDSDIGQTGPKSDTMSELMSEDNLKGISQGKRGSGTA